MKIAALIAALSLAATPALAAKCGPADRTLKLLQEKYQEIEVGNGTLAGGAVPVRLFVSPESGTWSLLAEPNVEILCLIAAGDNWEFPSLPEVETPELDG